MKAKNEKSRTRAYACALGVSEHMIAIGECTCTFSSKVHRCGGHPVFDCLHETRGNIGCVWIKVWWDIGHYFMVPGEMPNFVSDTRTRHLWSCPSWRGGDELCSLSLSRAVLRCRDQARLQSLPLLCSWVGNVHLPRSDTPRGLTNKPLCLCPRYQRVDWSVGAGYDSQQSSRECKRRISWNFIRRKHPKATISKERYIRDATGKSVFDSVSMSRRRLDIVVVENDRVTAIYEVTSPTANKTRQMEKESRIRTLAEGGWHIRTSGRRGSYMTSRMCKQFESM